MLIIDNAKPESDWDIALQWDFTLDWMEVLGRTGTLRRKLAQNLDVAAYKIDRVELRRANLAMRASVSEDGIPLSILIQVPLGCTEVSSTSCERWPTQGKNKAYNQ